jgi:hypothetical protein
VSELLASADLRLSGNVKWRQTVPLDRPGVYIVTSSTVPESRTDGLKPEAPIDLSIVAKWIESVPTLMLDGLHPTPEMLTERLSHFWLPDETVLYLGKASKSLRKRVGSYYRTTLGAPGPHAGGHWIKTLSLLDRLKVFYASSSNPESDENGMLAAFVRNVSSQTKILLRDPELPIPFANLEFPKGRSKNHGITGAVIRPG